MANNSGKTGNKGEKQGTSNRGFAAMDPQQQREIASKGGQAAHQLGRAHEFTPEEARAAGRKGGEAVSQNREHMAAIGRKGGQARGNANNNRQSTQDTRRSEDTRSNEDVRQSDETSRSEDYRESED